MIGKLCAAMLPGLPLLAGGIGLLLPRTSKRAAIWLAVSSTALVALLALWCAVDALGSFGVIGVGFTPIDLSFTLGSFGELDVTAVLRLDGLSALVASLVALVALAVQVYSIAHLARDERYVPYAAQLMLFTGAMLLVVSSADLITLLIGWELMGLCSYLLIGHDRTNPAAPAAARKAFVVTRVGDIGFLLGVVLLGADAGSFSFDQLGSASAATQTAAGFGLLAGVVGKSAQFPLHTWLPDAMAGPTPVSALIHSATMVAAGVYVIARLDAIVLSSDAVRLTLAAVGGVSILLGACAAAANDDLKRVLAWSTVSQLGYMLAGFTVSPGIAPPLFHMFTHAAFKALLFLSAGAVIVAVGSSSMSRMGGLRRSMPITALCAAAGLGALAGVPPLSGFWSKGSLLALAHEAAMSDGGTSGLAGAIVLGCGMIAVPITAFYCLRIWLLVFGGSYRGPAAPRDSGWLTLGPLIALTIPTVLLGVVPLYGQVGNWWTVAGATYGADALLAGETFTPLLDGSLVALGGALAWWLWSRAQQDPAQGLGRAKPVLADGCYGDAVQRTLVVRPVLAAARMAWAVNEHGVDGVVRALGLAVRSASGVVSRGHAPLGRYVSFAAAGAVGVALLTLLIARITA